MKPKHYISPEPLEWSTLCGIVHSGALLELSSDSTHRIRQCRTYLEQKLSHSSDLFYGVNTGFGALCNIQINREETEELQFFLVQSHACGMGDLVPADIIRLMLLLKVQSLALGFSGVRLEVVQRLLDLYNLDLLPVIFQLGSLGASGDLAPLAHLSLPLIGLGEVWDNGQKRPAGDTLKEHGLLPLRLQSKEGLALLNGTQFSTAYAAWCVSQAERLFELSNLCAALSVDAFGCHLSPFDERLHRLRPHPGQLRTAAAIRNWLRDSELAQKIKTQVQDPYAFRCAPQVHGASWDAIAYVRQTVLTEINAVTDNPNIFPDEDAILSGGNFHAQPIALALDHLSIALAELGSISERRTYQLLSGNRELPVFLTSRAGLHSGLMIPQYTAASIVSQNKQLCTPASVDSIVSSNGQEDHVSMAANAGTKAYRVVKNLERLLAIEFMTAAQAMDFRRPARTGSRLEAILADFRQVVPPLKSDRVLSEDMHRTVKFLRELTPEQRIA